MPDLSALILETDLDLMSVNSSILLANGLVYAFFMVVVGAALLRRPSSRALWYWAAALWMPVATVAGLRYFSLEPVFQWLPQLEGLASYWPMWGEATVLLSAVMSAQLLVWFGFRAFQGRRAWSYFWMVPVICAFPVALRLGVDVSSRSGDWFFAAPLEQSLALFISAVVMALSVLSLEGRRAGQAKDEPLLPSEKMASRILRVASLAPAVAIPFCLWDPLQISLQGWVSVAPSLWLAVLTSVLALALMGVAYCLPLIAKERAERKIEELNEDDILTGLPNRKSFVDALRKSLTEENCGGTLLLMDIDRFKRINDSHGHEAGDAVLRSFAEFLKSFAMDSTLCGRLGSAEFALYLKGLRGAQLDMLASQICRAASILPCEHKGTALRFTVSVGVADTDVAGLDFERIYEQADQALGSAKSAGRDQYARFVLPAAPSKMPLPSGAPFQLKSKAG